MEAINWHVVEYNGRDYAISLPTLGLMCTSIRFDTVNSFAISNVMTDFAS